MGASLPEGTESFDYVVIGAGSGGMASARRAAAMGKNVCMIENRVIGGTCVNVGCVPKKVMFNFANFYEDIARMDNVGLKGCEKASIDFKHMIAQRNAYVKRLNGIYERNVGRANITYIEGTASFVQDSVVQVGSRLFYAPHVLIASGSTPQPGTFPGSELCMNSDDFFALEDLDKKEKWIVIGGGYIGIELAQILTGFGIEVDLIIRGKPLKFIDDDIMDIWASSTGEHLKVFTQTPHEKVTKDAEGKLTVHCAGGKTFEGHKVLVALGRPPNLAPLGLDKTSIQVENGAIKVDQFSRTTASGVYAIGDVINAVNLTPVAVRAGRILAENIFNNRPELMMSYKNIATIIFSHPPIGTVGLSERDAKAEFGEENVQVFASTFTNMFFSLCHEHHKQKSLFKLVCRKIGEDNGHDWTHLKVVGAHGIGKNIDEMMQGVSIAITMGATKQDFDNSVAIHPSASEEFVTFEPRFVNIVEKQEVKQEEQ